MKFALNYSPQAMKLLQSGVIETDLIKCPAWPDLIEEVQANYPLYVHFSLVAGQNNLDEPGLDAVDRIRQQTKTPYVNSHLGARFEDLERTDDAEYVIETMLRDVWPLAECFGAENVILENAPWPDFFKDKPRIVSEAGVICKAVERSGCGFLLDLAHARLSAEAMGIDTYAYIELLPLDHLREVHITGIGLNREGDPEDHLPMTGADWALFDWSMQQIHCGAWPTPWVVSCEYGGIGPLFDWRSEAEVIARDIPRMYAAVHEE